MFPALEKSLSEGTELMIVDKYCLATSFKLVKLVEFCQYSMRLLVIDEIGIAKYVYNSKSISTLQTTCYSLLLAANSSCISQRLTHVFDLSKY